MAYIMDENEEERAKGKTVEVGKAYFQTKSKRFTILDAPGHKNYVPNMIQGAAQADIAALVISARDGEFEAGFQKGGQTREHAQLVKSMGVSQIIVLVNKMDCVKWSQERYCQIRDEVKPFLKKDCGFDVDNCVWFVPISSQENQNIGHRLVDHTDEKGAKIHMKLAPWYGSGPCLTDLFDQVALPVRDKTGPLRIPILDTNTEQGGTNFAFGKIENGLIQFDQSQQYLLQPFGKKIRIKSILNSKEECVAFASAGENVKLQIDGVKASLLAEGMLKGCVITDRKK